jgi:hypothetical protein
MGDTEVAMQMLLYIEKETQPYPRYTYIVFVESIDVIFKLAIEVPRFKRLPIDKHGLHEDISFNATQSRHQCISIQAKSTKNLMIRLVNYRDSAIGPVRWRLYDSMLSGGWRVHPRISFPISANHWLHIHNASCTCIPW